MLLIRFIFDAIKLSFVIFKFSTPLKYKLLFIFNYTTKIKIFQLKSFVIKDKEFILREIFKGLYAK